MPELFWDGAFTLPLFGTTGTQAILLLTEVPLAVGWVFSQLASGIKDGREQRQRLRNAAKTASPANNKLQNRRLERLEFYFLGPSTLKIMVNKVWVCTYGYWRLSVGLLELVREIAWGVNLSASDMSESLDSPFQYRLTCHNARKWDVKGCSILLLSRIAGTKM